jgi:hypothetical protein
VGTDGSGPIDVAVKLQYPGAGKALRSDMRQMARLGRIFAVIAPGVDTVVPGGPTYREAQLCMEMIADTGRMGSLDVMELNPALDQRNKTAEVAVDLVESLFGKSTLMRPSSDQQPG